MKKILLTLFALFIMLSMTVIVAASSQEVMPVTTSQPSVNEDVEDNLVLEDDAGITPDSPLWGLERAMEKVNLAFTFDKAKKAEKRLDHAHERLAEVNQMILENKVDKAEKAKEKHNKLLEHVEKDLADLEDNVDEASLEESASLEAKLNLHKATVERIGETKLKVKGLSEEDQTMIRNMIGELDNETEKLQVEVMQQKDRVKIKIKATEGMSDEELEDLEMQLSEKYGEDTHVVGKLDNVKKEKHVKGDDDEEYGADNESDSNNETEEIETEIEDNETEPVNETE